MAQPSWDGPYAKSTVLLMQELARGNRVLYVDYAYTWKDLVWSCLGKAKAPVLRMLGLRERLRIVEPDTQGVGLAVLTLPPVWPLQFLPAGTWYEMVNKLNGWIVARAIRKAMRRLHFQSPTVINAFAPALGHALVGKLRESSTIYYCYDDIREAPWSGKHGGRTEARFAAMADAVVVSSAALQQDKLRMNPRTYVVKNGVDVQAFSSPRGPMLPRRPQPIIGFVGSLDGRIDYALLKYLILSSPDLRFRFIGRVVDPQFETLRYLPNVEWIPPVPYTALAEYVDDFDLGIIPFVRSAFTEKIYPMKINEYLAMGKPVVRTSFAELGEFEGIVSVADDPAAFKSAIAAELAGDALSKAMHRIYFANKNSWEARARELTKIINELDHARQ